MILKATRKVFLDRILWCLTKLDESTVDLSKGVPFPKSLETSDFVKAMDTAIDLISPFTMFHDEPKEEAFQNNATDPETNTFAQTRQVVNTLIGHALSFVNLAQPYDRGPLTTVCQSVLREFLAFDRSATTTTSSLNDNRQSDSQQLDDNSQMQLNATRLENALYQLDGLVNDSLLRLVYGVFVEISAKPLDVLGELVECCDQSSQDANDQIVRFDEMADRLQQIGIFAAAFAPNQEGEFYLY